MKLTLKNSTTRVIPYRSTLLWEAPCPLETSRGGPTRSPGSRASGLHGVRAVSSTTQGLDILDVLKFLGVPERQLRRLRAKAHKGRRSDRHAAALVDATAARARCARYATASPADAARRPLPSSRRLSTGPYTQAGRDAIRRLEQPSECPSERPGYHHPSAGLGVTCSPLMMTTGMPSPSGKASQK